MKVTCTNVNEGLVKILNLLDKNTVERPSRNGNTRSFVEPVCIEYEYPNHNAMLIKSRDANPFFHIMESIWMLAGRNDVAFPATFAKNIAQYSDDGIVFNAPYGYRLRRNFGIDQLNAVCKELKQDNTTRRAVCLLWDPADLFKETKDKACNLELVFSIHNSRLNMTVFNRSNDIIYGTFGANAVHMSMIMMYVCSKLPDIKLGTYFQISSSLHAYTDGIEGNILNRINEELDNDYSDYDYYSLDISYFDEFVDEDISQFFGLWDSCDIGYSPAKLLAGYYDSSLFNDLVLPMLELWLKYKLSGKSKIKESDYQHIKATDWRKACQIWIENRSK